MHACYDFNTSPPTYEFVSFLLWCESERITRGEHTIEIILSPGRKDGFRGDSLWPYSAREREDMVRHVVMPMAPLLPSCVRILRGDGSSALGYRQRHYGFDVYVDSMRKIGRPLRIPYEKDDHLVTITLRECEHWPQRNSTKAEWIKAARDIERRGYDVVFVNDSKHPDQKIEDFETNVLAPIDIRERAELYKSAFCNLFVSNGPAYFCFALDAAAIMLKPTIESMGGCFDGKWLNRCGLTDQLPGNPPHQKIVWADDTADNIIRAFDDFAK